MKTKLLMLLTAALLLLNMGVQAQKKVHTLGDSTMAWYDESVTDTRGWGMFFGNFLTNGWESINYAKGGRDSRGGYNELWQNAKNNVHEGDYVLIQFAHNDSKYNGIDNEALQAYYTRIGDETNAAKVKNDGRGTTPSTTYKSWLKKIVDEVRAKGATPVLVSAVCRCYFGSDNQITKAGQHNLADKYDAIVGDELKTGQKLSVDDHSMDYTYQMKQLASELNVAFIDMTAETKKLYEEYKSYDKCYAALFDKGAETDNTHYNLTGALTAARLCAKLMKDQGILADNIEIPSDLSVTPSAADMGDVYVGQAGTKELTLTGLELDPPTGTITISPSEGILLSTDKQNWQNTLEVSYEGRSVIKTFYAKVAATAVGAFSGTVTASIGDKTAVANVTMNAIELGGGDPFTATWALTATDNAAVEGQATAAAAKVEGMAKYGNNSQKGLMVSTSEGGAWVKAEDDSPNQYVQFTVTAPDGQKLDINHIAMKVGGHGGGGMRCHVYYSTDGFVTRTTIYSPGSMASGVMNEVDVTPVIKLDEGDQLQIRVYPWYTSNATGKWLCIQDVVVGGQSKDAAGVNIAGTITYALDKGGLSENNDGAVMSPIELSAGFAAMKWAYDGSNEKVVVEGTTFQGATGNTKMMQLRYDAATSETLSTVANDDCSISLTLHPEDGFSFVPSKVSFLAGKFNSGNPHLTFAIQAGDTRQVLKDNVDLNRSKTNPLVDPSEFSEDITGMTATADAPLKLTFSFLNVQGTRSAGIGNLVIEGTLVGAAAQVTKYVLTTAVTPEGAGSITRDPDMEQYKEGTTVTLKATKNFGYTFKEWQDESGTAVSTDAQTTVTMDAAKTMKAVFEAVPVYTVTTQVTNDADRDGLGSITLTPNDHEGKYEAGTVVTATANVSKILKFTNWEDNSTSATREITVDADMTITAHYEVQDFIAVFDASKTAAYASVGPYPFAADLTWDATRNAKVSVVKQSDGSLVTGTNSTPVVRNRANSGVLPTLSGVFQNGYNTAQIAWQYQFSTTGFTAATFVADMAAKNAATKNWKAQYSTDGTTFSDLGEPWTVTANTLTPLSFTLPQEAIGQQIVYVRIMGTGTELLSDKYAFDAGTSEEGLEYATNSESQVGNVYVLGESEVEADETAPVVIATIPVNGATGVSSSGVITISFDEKIEAAEGADDATLNGEPLTPSWSKSSVSFSYSGLDYNTEYTLTLPANYVQDKSGNRYAEALTVTFTTMDRPVVSKSDYDAVVSTADELLSAIAAANSRSDKQQRYRIFLKKGTYQLPQSTTETFEAEDAAKTKFYSPITYITASNISFIGEDRDATVITNTIGDETYVNSLNQTVSIYERIGYGDVLQIKSGVSGTYFQDLTIKSGIPDSRGRNIALNDRGTNTICKNVCLWGYQDTYVTNTADGLYYIEGGIIRGRTDFICGGGDAYFNQVNIIMCEKGGYVTAPRNNQHYGYVFSDCTISGAAADVDGTYYLGRAWTSGAEAYFINTTMEVQPHAAGWKDWNNGPTRFAEYHSTSAIGNDIDLTGRATTINGTPNSPVLTADEAAQIGNLHNTFGTDWQPTLLTEQAPVPANVTLSGTTLSWDGSPYALLYAVSRNGEVIGFTTACTYDVAAAAAGAPRRDAANDEYTVRAANEMGGLCQPSAAATVTDPTAISTTPRADTLSAGNTVIYDLNGRQLSQPQRGVNIVRMSDGSTRKIVIKQ